MALDDTIAILRQAPLIGLLEFDALKLLAFSGDTRRTRAGEALFNRGDRSDGGYVVIQGSIGLAPRPDGPETIAGPGALIGRASLFLRTERPATATARETSELLRISPTLMRRVLAEYPGAAAGMHEALAADLAAFSSDLERVRRRFLNVGAR